MNDTGGRPTRRLLWGTAAGIVGIAVVVLVLAVLVAGPPRLPDRPGDAQAAPLPVAPVARAPAAPAASLADPGAPGPYAVGVIHRSLTRPSSTTGEPREVEPAIWYPATVVAAALPRDEDLDAVVDAPSEQAGRPYPVVVLSPGVGGPPAWQSFVATHLASHGFVVVGLAHPGTTPLPCPYRPCLGNPEALAWLAESRANRLDDVAFQLQTVLELSASGDPVLAGLLDPARLGIAGSSVGGSTAILAAAAEPRFRAVVGLAAAGADEIRAAMLAAVPTLRVPALLVSGGVDHMATPEWQQGLFETFAATAPEVWSVAVARAGHSISMSWCPDMFPECVDNQARPEALPLPQAHARANRWATAFLLRHVAGDARYAPLLDPALAATDPEVRVTVARAS